MKKNEEIDQRNSLDIICCTKYYK